MKVRFASVRTDSRGHFRNADDGGTRRKVMLYCLFKTMLFIRRIPKMIAKSENGLTGQGP